MMGTKQVTHTPGPWHWTEWGVKEKVFKVWKDGANIADVCMLPEANQFEELPNARLIAAAPDLLEACKAAIECWDQELLLSDAVGDELRAAIKKAERTTDGN